MGHSIMELLDPVSFGCWQDQSCPHNLFGFVWKSGNFEIEGFFFHHRDLSSKIQDEKWY